MKKLLLCCVVSFTTFGLTACSSTPDCDDGDVKDLLTQILKDEDIVPKKAKIKYSGFMTEFKDKDTKKVGCKVMASVDGEQESIPYTAQYTDDGMIYVEIKPFGF